MSTSDKQFDIIATTGKGFEDLGNSSSINDIGQVAL